MQTLDKMLMVLGAVVVVVGVLMYFGERLGLGGLPGDVAWRKGDTSVYVPIVSSIVLSIVLTVVLNLVMRIFR